MAARTDILDFDVLWNYNDPAATEQQFRALLPRAEQGTDRSYHAQLLTQIAPAHGMLQSKFVDEYVVIG